MMLSARAGEEARIEGLEKGADDYLVKPFGARELVARVRSQLVAERGAPRGGGPARPGRVVQPRQGRVPGHAEPRAAQPALPHRDRAAAHAHAAGGGGRRARAGDDRAAGPAPDPAGGRPARRLARRPGEDPARTAARWSCATRWPRASRWRARSWRSSRHELVVDVPAGLLVEADEQRLSQVVANLVTNAAKYTDARGRIEVRARAEADEVVLSVRDNGIGMSADLVPNVFDLFVQGHRGFDRSHGGLGLGLAIVRNLVALHGGTVSASSDGPGKGSQFSLPPPPAAVRPDREGRGGAGPGGARRGAAGAGRGRQPRRRGRAGGGAALQGLRGARRLRRPFRAGGRPRARARGRVPGPRAAGHGRLRAARPACARPSPPGRCGSSPSPATARRATASARGSPASTTTW